MRVDKRPKPVRAFWIFASVGLVVGALAGVGGAVVKGTDYASTAVLSWDPSSLRYTNANAYVPDATSLGVQVKGQAQKVLSDDVMTPAAQELGMTAKALRADVTATGSTDTNQLAITATATAPDRAKAIADEVVSAYQKEVRATFTAQYKEQAAALGDSIDELQLKIDATPASSASLSDNLSAQVATLTTQQVTLLSLAADPQIPVTVLREPIADANPAGPSVATLGVLGGGLGLLIGLALFALFRALGMGRMPQPVRTGADPRQIRGGLDVA